ncbi:MAG: hypothetical protein RLZZ458_3433 [Planctomycetota bacterium]|jgi:hypothetical protein
MSLSKLDARLQAERWTEQPQELLQVLQDFLLALRTDARPLTIGNGRRRQPVLQLQPAAAIPLLQKILPHELPLNEYRRTAHDSPLDSRLVIDFIDRLRSSEDPSLAPVDLPADLCDELEQTIRQFERWVRFQRKQQQELPLRSESLQTSIEIVGDEIFVRTDQDGSLKLKGAASIPMFLAFWRAPGHRLGLQSFLDIDRGTSQTHLERLATRLCSKLQDVLLEVVRLDNAYRLQKCRR